MLPIVLRRGRVRRAGEERSGKDTRPQCPTDANSADDASATQGRRRAGPGHDNNCRSPVGAADCVELVLLEVSLPHIPVSSVFNFSGADFKRIPRIPRESCDFSPLVYLFIWNDNLQIPATNFIIYPDIPSVSCTFLHSFHHAFKMRSGHYVWWKSDCEVSHSLG